MLLLLSGGAGIVTVVPGGHPGRQPRTADRTRAQRRRAVAQQAEDATLREDEDLILILAAQVRPRI